MSATDNPKYRALIMSLLSTQLWLEIQDEVKDTKMYQGNIKRDLDKLELKMEKLLGNEFDEMWKRDEKSFRIMMNRIYDIAKWVSTAEFEDIMDLGKGLAEGQIRFEEDE